MTTATTQKYSGARNELLRPEQYANTIDVYNSSNISVYINDFFLIDATQIGYQFQYDKKPIYSYNSEQYDKVAKGNVLVQGTLGVIFSETAYFEIMRQEIVKSFANLSYEEIQKRRADSGDILDNVIYGQPVRSEYTKQVKATVSSENYNNTIYPDKVQILSNKDPKTGQVLISPSVRYKTLYDYMGGRNDGYSNFEDVAERLEDQVWGMKHGMHERGTLRDDVNAGYAVWDNNYKRIRNAMEMDYELIRSGNQYLSSVMSHERNPLTLYIIFGDYNAPPAEHTVEAINDIHFTSKQIAVNNDGVPTMALYSFFGNTLNGDTNTILHNYNQLMKEEHNG